MCRPSYEFPVYRRSRSGWPLVGLLLPGFLCLSLLTQREPASQDSDQPIQTEPQYQLKFMPDLKQAWLGERFEIELWVTDAPPSLDMNQIEFVLEVTPGRVTIPDVIYSSPGNFIPDAFLVILDITHSESQTSATYRIGVYAGGSNTGQGRLATLAFDAVSEGTAEIVLSGISASDSSTSSLASPTSATGGISIGLETTGLPFDGAYTLSAEGQADPKRPSRSLPARFELDSWQADDNREGKL